MMPHIHFLFGVTYIYVFQSPDLGYLDIILFLLGCLSPDLDFIIAYRLRSNHRRLVSHYPFSWLIATVFASLLQSPLIWFCWGGFLHLLIDTLDWEVVLFGPFFSFGFSFLSLEYRDHYKEFPFFQMLIEYYSNKKILLLEGIFFLLCFLSLFTR